MCLRVCEFDSYIQGILGINAVVLPMHHNHCDVVFVCTVVVIETSKELR